tara:strand:- start:88 stop:579 length:492 start_codon:yes stop_codon:yes gene_type:complete
MTATGVTALKAYFETGDQPTSAEFAHVMDSFLNLTDGSTITSSATKGLKQGAFLIPCYPNVAPSALSGAGAIPVLQYYTAWTTTGAQAGTIAAGTELGQMKKVQLIVDGGDGTLTITNPVSASLDIITFADAGDFCLLQWNGTAWRILELGNDADGATAATVA